MRNSYRTIRNLQILATAVFWISILPQFYTTGLPVGTLTIPVRFLFWIMTIGFSRGTWILRRAGRISISSADPSSQHA